MYKENNSLIEDFELTIGDSSETIFFSPGYNQLLNNDWLCTMCIMDEEETEIILQRELPITADMKYFKFLLSPLETIKFVQGTYSLAIEIKNKSIGYNKEIVSCYIKTLKNKVTVIPPAPVFTSDLVISVPENQVTCCTLQATDTIKYSITGGDSAELNINEETGEVTFKVAPNYEIKNLYAFVAQAIGLGGTTSETIIVNITDIAVEPNAPVFITPNTVNVPENQYNAILLHASDTNVYSISSGDSAEFNIDIITGEVKFNSKPDYETKNIYQFIASASGPGGVTNELITINVTDVNENPAPYFVMDTYRAIEESGYEAITLSAVNATSYSISGGDSIDLNVNSETGVVMFKNPTNAAEKSDYYFTATATGLGGSTSTDIHIHIYDIIQIKENGEEPR